MQNPNAIGCITVYQVEIPYAALGSRWLGRDKPQRLDSTVVTVETEAGLCGVGESCPIGAIYLPAFAGGLRAAIAEMAPALFGVDATQINLVNRVMDAALFGHGYAKAAILHLAHATAPERLLYIWDIADLTSLATVANPLPRRAGRLQAHDIPGLGVAPRAEVLGEPVAVYN